jgi:hypothetical protein
MCHFWIKGLGPTGSDAILDEVFDAGIEDEYGGEKKDVEPADPKISRPIYMLNKAAGTREKLTQQLTGEMLSSYIGSGKRHECMSSSGRQ